MVDNTGSDCDLCSSLAGLKRKGKYYLYTMYHTYMNNDMVDEYAGHTRICKEGVGNAGDICRCGPPPTVCWQRSTGRFCGFKCPAIETSAGMGHKNGPATDILHPNKLLIHEPCTYLWNFFSTPPTTVTAHFEQFHNSWL